MLARAEPRKVPRFCRGIVYSAEAWGLLPCGVSIRFNDVGSFWYTLTEDIKAPQSARSRAQMGTRRGNGKIFFSKGRCAEIRRQRLIRSGMSSEFSKYTTVTTAPNSQTSYPVSFKATKFRAYETAPKSSRSQSTPQWPMNRRPHSHLRRRQREPRNPSARHCSTIRYSPFRSSVDVLARSC